MKNLVSLLALVILSAAIFSCQKIKEKGFTHLPYQQTIEGRWGLIGTDGKVLFSNEFDEKPSNAINGLFVVKNQNGLFEYYTSTEQPKLIAGPYIQAGLFFDEVAPVVGKDSPISFIRKDGSEAFAITEYDGTAIVMATNFSEGMAEIVNADSKCGYVNTKGDIVIRPVYARAFPFKEGCALVYDSSGNPADEEKIFIDKNGKVVLKLESSISAIHEALSDGLVGFTDDPEMMEWGFMNIKGEKIIKPNSKFVSVKPFYGGYSVFFDGSNYGVMDKTGEVVIRPKYQDIQYGEGQLFFAKENGKYALINSSDEKITDYLYDSFTGFFGGKCFVLERSNFLLIDSKGKALNSESYASVINEYQPELFVSDYFDMSVEIKQVINSITDNSIDDLSIGVTAGEMFPIFDYPSKESLRGKSSMKDIVGTKNIQAERVVEFSSQLSTPIKERVFKRDIWGKGYYEDEITGWKFAESAKAQSIRYNITLLNKAAGRVTSAIEILKSMTTKENVRLTIDSAGVNKIVLKLRN